MLILAVNVIANEPLMYDVDDAPIILPTAVFVIVNKFVASVVSVPDVSVSIPVLASDTGVLKVTPLALLMVKLFNEMFVPPMACAVLPLKSQRSAIRSECSRRY